MWNRILYFSVIVLLPFPAAAAAAEALADIQVETQRVAEGVFMLRARGGNIGAVTGRDGVFLVDDQFAPLVPKIRTAIESLPDGKGKPLRFVLNTHFHGDHTGGNENLGNAGAVIVAHDNVRARMSTEQFRNDFIASGGKSLEAALPVVTFNDRVTFHVNGHTLETRHYPHAHTDGDSVVWFRESNVVHTGDIYFQHGFPFIDVARGGSVNGLIRAVEDILARADDKTVIMPGHGAVSDKAELTGYRNMLIELRQRVAAQLEAGSTLQEVQAMDLAEDYRERWDWDFISAERFIETLYSNLSDSAHGHH